MHSDPTFLPRHGDFSRRSPGAWNGGDDRVYTTVHQVAQTVMDIAGPLFWAVLILAFVVGPLGIDGSRLH